MTHYRGRCVVLWLAAALAACSGDVNGGVGSNAIDTDPPGGDTITPGDSAGGGPITPGDVDQGNPGPVGEGDPGPVPPGDGGVPVDEGDPGPVGPGDEGAPVGEGDPGPVPPGDGGGPDDGGDPPPPVPPATAMVGRVLIATEGHNACSLDTGTCVIDFGDVTVGNSVQRSFMITNTGGIYLTITQLQPPTTNGFTVVDARKIKQGTSIVTDALNLRQGIGIGPGKTVDVHVRFAPVATGVVHSTWTIAANDDHVAQSVTLTGNGTP